MNNFKKIWKRKGSRAWLLTSTIVLVVLLVASLVLTQNGFLYQSVSIFLGRERQVLVSGDPSGYVRYETDEGIDNKADALAAANAVNEEIVEEGIVLLKNEDNALPLKEGAGELLCRLKNQGFRLCVATATKAPLPQMALERLGLLDTVEFVLTCDEAGRGKDFPDIYLQCAQRLGLPPQEIWVFEDSIHCVRTARHAGFPVIGVYDEDSAGNWERIRERSSGWVLSLRELLRD